MIDWPALFRDWMTPIVAVAGLGLGVWNRVDKWREDRKKAADALPRVRVSNLGQERVESETHSLRPVMVEFHNPTRHRWKVTHAQLIEPEAASIQKRGGSDVWARDLALEWHIVSIDEDQGKTQGQVVMRFERANGDQPPKMREIGIRFRLEEVSAKRWWRPRRRCRLEARTARFF